LRSGLPAESVIPALRGLASSGLLLLGILLFLALGRPPSPQAEWLAALAAGAVAARGVLALPATRRGLGTFADPLDLTVGLGLILCALAWTGGVGSGLFPLLLVDLVLARLFLGVAAARFLGVVTILGLVTVAALFPAGGASPLVAAGRCAWPLAVVMVMELAGVAAGRARAGSRGHASPGPTREGPAWPALPGERNGLQGILHDLRSPLTALRLYAELVADRVRKGQPVLPEHVEHLETEIDLMQSLLETQDRSSRAARVRWRRQESFDLVKLLGALAHSYRLLQGDRLRIEFIAEGPKLQVSADPVAVQRCLRNLLDNAIKYTPEGGQVRIRAGQSGGEARVVISDTGMGMSEIDRQRAFDFSYRSPAARASGAAGSGLGLSLSRELLEANGGRIVLSSEPGRGSDVTVLLPVAPEGRS
jgi:signal transduction histidine kinase